MMDVIDDVPGVPGLDVGAHLDAVRRAPRRSTKFTIHVTTSSCGLDGGGALPSVKRGVWISITFDFPNDARTIR